MAADDKNKVTILRLRKHKREGTKTVMTTAYDYPQARIADGAGVSRYNLSSADQLVKLLYYMYHSKHKNDFIYTLPGGGSKSTLRDRLDFSESKIRAKTGHLSRVSCISGYLFTDRYGPLAFSILMNGYTGSSTPYKNIQDKIVSFLLHD